MMLQPAGTHVAKAAVAAAEAVRFLESFRLIPVAGQAAAGADPSP